MAKKSNMERKDEAYEKATRLFTTYSKFVLVGIENIVSTQLKEIKKQWGGDVEFLMGKNSAIRRAIKDLNRPDLSEIHDMLKGNMCFVFFRNSIRDVKGVIKENMREACAKVGDIAQREVWVESFVTGMTPDKTSYFQVLGIATKITKGKVEIIAPYKVLSSGDRVGPSQANLLSLLNIKPFSYRMEMFTVYEDGLIYDSCLADIEEADVFASLHSAIACIAQASLGAGFTTQASVPYEVRNAFRDILAVSFGSGFEIKEQSMVKA